MYRFSGQVYFRLPFFKYLSRSVYSVQTLRNAPSEKSSQIFFFRYHLVFICAVLRDDARRLALDRSFILTKPRNLLKGQLVAL